MARVVEQVQRYTAHRHDGKVRPAAFVNSVNTVVWRGAAEPVVGEDRRVSVGV